MVLSPPVYAQAVVDPAVTWLALWLMVGLTAALHMLVDNLIDQVHPRHAQNRSRRNRFTSQDRYTLKIGPSPRVCFAKDVSVKSANLDGMATSFLTKLEIEHRGASCVH
jgi:hypothetical protein